MEELTQEEREKIKYLMNGLNMYSRQLGEMLDPVKFEKARYDVAKRGDAVIGVIQEVQGILRKRESDEQ